MAEMESLKAVKAPLAFREALNQNQPSTKAGKAPKTAPKASFKATSEATSAVTSAVPSTSVPIEPEIWTKVGPKKPAKPVSKPISTFTQDLKQASTKEDKLKLLLKKPVSLDQRSDHVASVMVQLPLSAKAQQQPLTSWRSAMKELTGHQPLAISMIHPRKAEVFFDGNVIDSVTNSLHSEGYLLPMEPLTDRDILRRKSSYLQGYFRPLRRAMFQGFSRAQQDKLLDLAVASCKTVFSDPVQRKLWSHHCLKDREWLQELVSHSPEEAMDSDMGL
jgi:hypothetical protein